MKREHGRFGFKNSNQSFNRSGVRDFKRDFMGDIMSHRQIQQITKRIASDLESKKAASKLPMEHTKMAL